MAITPDLATCNLALAQVPSAPISSINETSLAAREVVRAYVQCLPELLERHQFRFARVRTSLAAVANDRPLEWISAFAVPSDAASIQGIHIDPGADLTGVVWHHHWGDIERPRFDVADTTLYTNLPAAILEYTTSNVLPAQFTAMFRNALVMEIAARIVMPVFKDRQRQGDLIKAASGAWDRAVADDMNLAPDLLYSFVPHDIQARHEGSGSVYGDTWGWRP